MDVEVVKEENRVGYIFRDEIVKTGEGEPPMPMKSTYALDGSYIGTEQDAKYLYGIKGIIPQRRKEGIDVATIGFCEKENKWYGWSHRAISGFTIGDKVEGDHVCKDILGDGFEAKTMEDARRMAEVFAEEVG